MLRGSYQFKNNTWTTFLPTSQYGWADGESATDFLTRLGFDMEVAYARAGEMVVLNELLKVELYQAIAPPITPYEACVFVAFRDFPDRGMMALVDNINELILLLETLAPVVALPIQRQK